MIIMVIIIIMIIIILLLLLKFIYTRASKKRNACAKNSRGYMYSLILAHSYISN